MNRIKRYLVGFALFGILSPTVSIRTVEATSHSSVVATTFAFFAEAQARRGGGIRMRGGGAMRARSFSRPSFNRSNFNRSGFKRPAPSQSRYYGGNFPKSKRATSIRPVSSRPKSNRVTSQNIKLNRSTSKPDTAIKRKWNSLNPSQQSQVKQQIRQKRPAVSSQRKLDESQKQQLKQKWNTLDPNKQQQVKQQLKSKWQNGQRPNRPGDNPAHKPIHRPEYGHGDHGHHHHGHHGHHHHHYHHYPYYGWGGYWPWFWGSAITIGAVVSTIPENDCDDIYIDGKHYKECEGVLFEPVYQGDDVEYKVVKMDEKK